MEPASNENQARQQPPPPPPPPPPPAVIQATPPHRKCPRCDSSNTKFCYYNNYSLTQPRHFCRACRRYWTHGGTLRNVPIGGGCRKNKRSSKASSSSNSASRCQNSAVSRAPPMHTSFFGGSGGQVFFPASYAALRASSPAAGVNLGSGGGGSGQFAANLSLLQAMSLHQSLQSQAANQFQPPGNLFPAQQNLINPVIRPCAQNITANTAAAGSSSSASGSSFWNSVAGVANQAGPSFTAPNQAPNQWSTDDNTNNKNDRGFNRSQQ